MFALQGKNGVDDGVATRPDMHIANACDCNTAKYRCDICNTTPDMHSPLTLGSQSHFGVRPDMKLHLP